MKDVGVLSQITISPLSIDWDIENFFERSPKQNIYYQSPYFIFGESTWRFILYPNGNSNDGTAGKVELHLQKLKSFIESHYVSFKMGIKYGDGTIYKSKYFKYCFKEDDDMCGAPDMAKRSDLSRNREKLSPKNKLTVFIEDLVLHDLNVDINLEACLSSGEKTCIKDAKENPTLSDSEGVNILVRSLKNLLENEEDCDVAFNVEHREFHAHRVLLAARSPVFASMFRHDMSEKNTGVVNIPDCSADAFKELLLYLYSGKVSHSSIDVTLDLYEASVKYDLEYLKGKCVHFMKDDISVDTFCDILAISLKHNEMILIKIGTEFFKEHMRNILPTMKWQMFLKENHIAANELLMKAIEK